MLTNEIKNEKAITFVSLVVSVIVILILVGAGISMIKGDNGLINKALESKKMAKDGSTLEKIKMEVMNSDENYADLKSNLQKLGASNLPDKERYPLYFEINDQSYRIDEDWNVTNSSNVVFSAQNLNFNGTNDYIDTKIALYNEENFNKDFFIRLTISEFGSYSNSATVIGTQLENSSLGYPGFCVRRRVDSSTVQLVFGNGQNYSTDLNSYIDHTFIIARIRGNIFYGFEDGGLTWVKDVSNLSYFNTTLTIGAALDANNAPWRFFKGKISNIQVILNDSTVNSNRIYTKLYDNNTLVFSSNDTTLPNRTLTKSYNDANIGLTEYTVNENTGSITTPWYEDRDKITKVEIIDEITPISIKGWFGQLNNLTEIIGLKNMNIQYVSDMSFLFYNCKKLENIDLSKNYNDCVISLQCTFYGCNDLKKIDISGIHTDNTTNMKYTFFECTSLTKLDLNSWNISNVKYINCMFKYCTNLEEINIESWKGENIIQVSEAFNNCSKLTSINMPNFNPTNLTSMASFFLHCSSLQNLNLSGMTMEKITWLGDTFNQCTSLKELKLNSADFSKVTQWNWTFYCIPNDVFIYVKDETQKNYIKNNASASNKTFTDSNFVL